MQGQRAAAVCIHHVQIVALGSLACKYDDSHIVVILKGLLQFRGVEICRFFLIDSGAIHYAHREAQTKVHDLATADGALAVSVEHGLIDFKAIIQQCLTQVYRILRAKIRSAACGRALVSRVIRSMAEQRDLALVCGQRQSTALVFQKDCTLLHLIYILLKGCFDELGLIFFIECTELTLIIDVVARTVAHELAALYAESRVDRTHIVERYRCAEDKHCQQKCIDRCKSTPQVGTL